MSDTEAPPPKKKRKFKTRSFDNKFYVTAYELARDGQSNSSIRSALGVKYSTFTNWIEKDPAFADALERGRELKAGKAADFFEYIYQRLPKNLQEVWDEIAQMDSDDDDYSDVLDNLLRDKGRRARQHLFLHAFVSSHFNASEACRIVHIPYSAVQDWLESDERFRDLFREMNEHKKNFFENALIKLVKKGDPLATIFVNKTINRDRGYDDKVKVEVSGKIEHSVDSIQLHDLDLPIEVHRAVLEAMRRRREQLKNPGAVAALPAPMKVIEAEFEKK